jgi:hypothetical protein
MPLSPLAAEINLDVGVVNKRFRAAAQLIIQISGINARLFQSSPRKPLEADLKGRSASQNHEWIDLPG